jgi:nitrogen fixation protein NifU and related proteins
MYCNSFTDIVMDHFMCPRNIGSMTDADGEGSSGDPECGDFLTIYIKVKDNIIEDISFLVFGCVAAIATSSVTTVLAKGKSLEEALKICEMDIVKALGGLPENKIHCSVLGASALRNAIHNFYTKTHISD